MHWKLLATPIILNFLVWGIHWHWILLVLSHSSSSFFFFFHELFLLFFHNFLLLQESSTCWCSLRFILNTPLISMLHLLPNFICFLGFILFCGSTTPVFSLDLNRNIQLPPLPRSSTDTSKLAIGHTNHHLLQPDFSFMFCVSVSNYTQLTWKCCQPDFPSYSLFSQSVYKLCQMWPLKYFRKITSSCSPPCSKPKPLHLSRELLPSFLKWLTPSQLTLRIYFLHRYRDDINYRLSQLFHA